MDMDENEMQSFVIMDWNIWQSTTPSSSFLVATYVESIVDDSVWLEYPSGKIYAGNSF